MRARRAASGLLPGTAAEGLGVKRHGRVCKTPVVRSADEITRAVLLRHGCALEYLTLGWNVVGSVVLAVAAVAARSFALAGFRLASLIEIGASIVVVWQLSGTGRSRQRRALRLVGVAYMLVVHAGREVRAVVCEPR
jgi:hypothetical protein